MSKVMIFGGTTEGRNLCEFCAGIRLPIVYCVATQDGAHPVEALLNVDIRVGRLEAAQMVALFQQKELLLVVDATHPYAENVSGNIVAACRQTNVPLLRIMRESRMEKGCSYFKTMDDLVAWVAKEPGNIFVTTGFSAAAAFCSIADYRNRVWMRILPSVDSLQTCLDFGYRPDRLICMQGPFSESMNYEMFRATAARILVTKESGAAGGFPEKIRAAQRLGMTTAVLSKPREPEGVSLMEAKQRLTALSI